ncbi:protein-S-isoprenylcysteine O-methyltransferase [Glutamicibacter ardleyensis]|uniref:Protein-S-isoprenylcysteine O-methyltransferase n=1 Tax=Glutamicibacter ardleyensis TaxID=225894 RepID=A0ABQ2DFZ4_9MICC|nr:protein-S-isoprenylcysteine O-methyltransferase [Glutamicibacter ardleyensis]
MSNRLVNSSATNEPHLQRNNQLMLARTYFAVQGVGGLLWWFAVFVSPTVTMLTLGDLPPLLLAWFDIPLFALASLLIACNIRAALWVAIPWTWLMTGLMLVYALISTNAGWGALIMLAASFASGAAGLVLWFGRFPSQWFASGPFRFRTARSKRTRAHIRQTFAQLLCFWFVFLALFPSLIIFAEHRFAVHVSFADWVRLTGYVLLLLASALGVWSATIMAKLGQGTPLPSAMPQYLVVRGPYRYVRNPMAVAGIVQGVSVGLIANSWLIILYSLSGSIIWNLMVRPLEERDLEEKFGESFTRYCAEVSCWLPKFRHTSKRG